MKVAAYERYGPPDVVRLIEVEKPTPKNGEVLIRVRATTVSSGDWRVRSLEVPAGFELLSRLFLGYSRPRQPIFGTETVLVNGASGAVGVALVQLARHFGAEVTAVCSGANSELVRSLGAARVIDYTQEDFTRNGETYDVIADTAGTAPFSRCRGSLKKGGRLLLILAGLGETLRAPWISLWGDKRVIAGPAAEDADDLRLLAELSSADKFKPIIDRRYPFDQIVEAHRYVDTGRKRGSVVVTLGE
jgi:NADPH:quinone reductase-like Zn-dependent oxidoreductase